MTFNVRHSTFDFWFSIPALWHSNFDRKLLTVDYQGLTCDFWLSMFGFLCLIFDFPIFTFACRLSPAFGFDSWLSTLEFSCSTLAFVFFTFGFLLLTSKFWPLILTCNIWLSTLDIWLSNVYFWLSTLNFWLSTLVYFWHSVFRLLICDYWLFLLAKEGNL